MNIVKSLLNKIELLKISTEKVIQIKIRFFYDIKIDKLNLKIIRKMEEKL